MNKLDLSLSSSWKTILSSELKADYFLTLKSFLVHETLEHVVFPSELNIFKAFRLTPFHKVKVVIIGQDPYHGPNQANGLCFSVNDGITYPPSLVNIFKELKNDLGINYPSTGNLTTWAEQGVLLLNATLTVRQGEPNSHQNIGWQKFTDAVIEKLSTENEGIIFLLWGGFAKKKGKKIESEKHHILTCGHPSPLSANKGHWFGNKHFSKTNELLKKMNKSTINWNLD